MTEILHVIGQGLRCPCYIILLLIAVVIIEIGFVICEAAQRAGRDKANTVAKLGPMFGLLGTLIPLGPGIVALGRSDTAALSQSMAEKAFHHKKNSARTANDSQMPLWISGAVFSISAGAVRVKEI